MQFKCCHGNFNLKKKKLCRLLIKKKEFLTVEVRVIVSLSLLCEYGKKDTNYK